MPTRLFDSEFRRSLDELALAVRRLTVERRRRRVRGSGQEFADHRDYVPGDDIRYINWPVYGRLEKLVIRIFESDRPPHATLLVDESRSMALGRPPRFDAVRRLAAALAFVVLSEEGAVGVKAFAGATADLPPVSGRGSIDEVFAFLAARRPAGGADLDLAARELAHSRVRRGPAIVLTDGFEVEGLDAAIRRLRYARFDVLLVQLLLPEELDPPRHRLVTLRGVETHRRLRLSQSAAICHRYQNALARHRDRLGKLCAEHGAMFASAPAGQPVTDTVLDLFRRGALAGM